MRSSVVTIVIAMFFSGASSSQPAKSIDELFIQLGSDDYHVRQTAADHLVEQGDAVRRQVKKLADDPSDAERRNLAAGILARLDRQDREGPTFITLHEHGVDAQTTLSDLAAQANVPLHFSPNAARVGRLSAVTIDLDHTPFWFAVAEFCRQTHTHVRAESAGGIEIGNGQNSEPPMGPLYEAGPFSIAVVSSTRNSQIHYADPAAAPVVNDNIEIEVFTDPRAHPVDLLPPILDEAVDEHGHSLLPPARPHFVGSSSHGKWARSFSCELALTGESHTLKRLHGSLDATFAAESQTVTLPDLQASLHHGVSVGEASLECTACKFNGHEGSYTLSFTRKTPGSLNLQGLQLIDAAGTVIYEGRGATALTEAGTFAMSGSINRSDVIKLPVSLVWTVPTKTETVHEPFVFEGLRLP